MSSNNDQLAEQVRAMVRLKAAEIAFRELPRIAEHLPYESACCGPSCFAIAPTRWIAAASIARGRSLSSGGTAAGRS